MICEEAAVGAALFRVGAGVIGSVWEPNIMRANLFRLGAPTLFMERC